MHVQVVNPSLTVVEHYFGTVRYIRGSEQGWADGERSAQIQINGHPAVIYVERGVRYEMHDGSLVKTIQPTTVNWPAWGSASVEQTDLFIDVLREAKSIAIGFDLGDGYPTGE